MLVYDGMILENGEALHHCPFTPIMSYSTILSNLLVTIIPIKRLLNVNAIAQYKVGSSSF